MGRIIISQEDEQGSVMIIALVILVLLTLIGISATNTSDIEIQISKNEQEYIKEFYVADSSWRQGVQWLDSLAAKPSLVNSTLFLNDETANLNYLNVRNYGNGENGVFNDDFHEGTQDGTLAAGADRKNYWYKVAYVDANGPDGERAPLFGEGFRKYTFIIKGHAGGANGQEVEVTVTRVMESGGY